LTIKDSYSKGFEGTTKYYWIIELDSIKRSDNIFYPLLITGFSKSNLENCCQGNEVDPFVLTSADTVFDLGSKYFKELKTLDKLLITYRKKTQQIIKKWIINKNIEKISFYITPITGKFCSSTLAKTGQFRTGYKGKIFLPFSSFKLNNDFWNSPKMVVFSTFDFSNFKFKIDQ